jgi:hypothetical protein
VVVIDPVVKALVVDGIVTEAYLVWDIPEHLSSWVTAPTEVGPGWLYDGQTFSPPAQG